MKISESELELGLEELAEDFEYYLIRTRRFLDQQENSGEGSAEHLFLCLTEALRDVLLRDSELGVLTELRCHLNSYDQGPE